MQVKGSDPWQTQRFGHHVFCRLEQAQHVPKFMPPVTERGVHFLLLKIEATSGAATCAAAALLGQGRGGKREILTQTPFPGHRLPERAAGRGYLRLGGTCTR